MNKCRLVRCSVWCACAFETKCGYGFHVGHFDRNEISFRVIEYHVNTTWNEMPTHVHQTIGSFWNAAEMKLHVNRTCFHAGLKSQTGMSSFRLSCERTFIVRAAGKKLASWKNSLGRGFPKSNCEIKIRIFSSFILIFNLRKL